MDAQVYNFSPPKIIDWEMETSLSYEIRRARYEDVDYIASNFRKADLLEIKVITNGLDPRTVLAGSLEASEYSCWTGLAEDRPVVMFGVSPEDPTELYQHPGIIWCLGTRDLRDRVAIEFIRRSKPCFDYISSEFDIVYNAVYIGNADSIKWLNWLGFKFDGVFTVNHKGSEYQFLRFFKVTSKCVSP
jgi:hypothetical protein